MACRKMSTPLRLLVVAAALASASLAASNFDDVHERPPVQTVWQYHGAGHRLYGSRRLTSNGNSPYGSNGDDGVQTVSVSATVKNISNFDQTELVKAIKEKLGSAATDVVPKIEFKVTVALTFPSGGLNTTQQEDLKQKLATEFDVDPSKIKLTITNTRRLQEHGGGYPRILTNAGATSVTAEITSENQTVAAAVTKKASNAAEMKQLAAVATGIDAATISSKAPTISVTTVFEMPASSTVEPLDASDLKTIANDVGLADVTVSNPPNSELTDSAPQGGIAAAVAAVAWVAGVVAVV